MSFINVVFYPSSISLHWPISDEHRITDPIYPLIRFASRWEPHLTIITLLHVVVFSSLRLILTFCLKLCPGVVHDRFATMHQRSRKAREREREREKERVRDRLKHLARSTRAVLVAPRNPALIYTRPVRRSINPGPIVKRGECDRPTGRP